MRSIVTRRRVLHGIAAGALAHTSGSLVALSVMSSASSSGTGSVRFGAQTNAFPIVPSRWETFLQALAQIKAAGYAGFETGFINLRGQLKQPAQARRDIAATGLTFIGVHIFLPEYDAATDVAPRELYESVGRQAAELGAERLILSGAPAVTADEIKRKADGLNIAGDFAAKLGLKVAYHNHWWEAKYDGRELEALYAATDASKVSFLMDVGHASRTNLDLAAFLRAHAARLTGLHFRDYVQGKQVPLGEGSFPLSAVAAALKSVNWSGWAMNEEEREDGTKLGLAVLEPSLKSLRKAFSA